MKAGRRARRLVAAAALVSLAACASERAGSSAAGGGEPPAALSDETRSQLEVALDGCTAESGYDPESTAVTGLGPNELADGELAYRDCAYGALNGVVRPNLRLPALLDELIAADRQLTAAIPEGRATRSQREAAVDVRVADIRQQETAIRDAELAASASLISERDNLRRQQEMMDFRRQLDVVNQLF